MEHDSTLVGSLERGLAVLTALIECGPMRQSALARELNLPKATVHRLLGTLEAAGFAVRTPEGSFQPGPRLLLARLSIVAPVVESCHATLAELARATGEAANLAMLVGAQAAYLDAVRGSHAVGIFTEIGARVPLHATGVGKALLASMPAKQRAHLLGQLELARYTVATITTPERLASEIEQAHARGYVVDLEEYMEGVRCVARSVRVLEVPVAISISGPAPRLDIDHLHALGHLLVEHLPS